MDTASLATSMVAMTTASTRMNVQFAVLAKKFEMQRDAMNMLLPAPQAPAPAGMGRLVDKTA